jgi:hypothetical protein
MKSNIHDVTTLSETLGLIIRPAFCGAFLWYANYTPARMIGRTGILANYTNSKRAERGQEYQR